MSSIPMFRSMPRRNPEGQAPLAKWPLATTIRSPASPWDVDDSTAQTVSKLNSYFGFRPAAKSSHASPDILGYSPELGPDRTPELRHDTPSDTRTRTSSFGPETPPTRFDPSFSSEPFVQSMTPARSGGHSHLRSYSDGCSFQSLHSEALHRAGLESTSSMDYDLKQHSHTAPMPRPGDSPQHQPPAQETPSPHQSYTINLTRDSRSVTLCLTSGSAPAPTQPTITCYRQSYLPQSATYAEFFRASEAISLLQHMVNAPSQPFIPFSKRERSDLMLRMRSLPESLSMGDPCPFARQWTGFFSAELSAGRTWEAGTVIFPWRMLEKLMSSLNSECARKRRMQSKATADLLRRELEDVGPRGQQGYYSHATPDSSRTVSLRLASEAETEDRNSVSSASPPPRTPTDLNHPPPPPPRIQFARERVKSPSMSASPIRRRRQNSEPVRRLSLSPPRIALLKSNPSRHNLRRLAAASAPGRPVFYDSIRTWPASSHRSRVRLPPCSRFLELASEGKDSHHPIVL